MHSEADQCGDISTFISKVALDYFQGYLKSGKLIWVGTGTVQLGLDEFQAGFDVWTTIKVVGH
jgi:hypothetical protein